MFQAIDVHGDYNFLESSEWVLPAVKFHLRPSGNRPRDSFPFVITFIDPVTGGVTSYHVMDPFAHVSDSYFVSLYCFCSPEKQ